MKGHLLFVEAAANLMNRFSSNTPSVEFLIVGNPFMPGDQNYFDELKVRIAALGLRDRFHFTGHLSPPYSAMAAADIVVNCSVVPEPFGLTLIEAMMLGRPVIAPAAGGPLEIIEPDVSGILFRPGDSQGLADAMGALMDKETRLRLSEQGKAHALKKFEVRKMVQDLEAGYSKIF
jgi:glycosyltransferase involved in cell wall biosynthesis